MSFSSNDRAFFEQVADVLEQRIRDRELVAGAELPSETSAHGGSLAWAGRRSARRCFICSGRDSSILRAGSRARVTAPER